MQRHTAIEISSVIAAAGLGAGLMYVFDPGRGRRRRAFASEKVRHFGRVAAMQSNKALSDLKNRAQGVSAEVKHLIHKNEDVPDDILVARVRSRLGRVVSHPGSIEVTADSGRVTLTGPILEKEVDTLLKCVRKVPGTKSVTNKLEPRAFSDNVSSLQGGRKRVPRPELLQENWSPGIRFLMGGVATGLIVYGIRRGHAAGTLAGTTGLAILGRAVTNLPMKRIARIPTERLEASYLELAKAL
jgi:hypothetical protein